MLCIFRNTLTAVALFPVREIIAEVGGGIYVINDIGFIIYCDITTVRTYMLVISRGSTGGEDSCCRVFMVVCNSVSHLGGIADKTTANENGIATGFAACAVISPIAEGMGVLFVGRIISIGIEDAAFVAQTVIVYISVLTYSFTGSDVLVVTDSFVFGLHSVDNPIAILADVDGGSNAVFAVISIFAIFTISANSLVFGLYVIDDPIAVLTDSDGGSNAVLAGGTIVSILTVGAVDTVRTDGLMLGLYAVDNPIAILADLDGGCNAVVSILAIFSIGAVSTGDSLLALRTLLALRALLALRTLWSL